MYLYMYIHIYCTTIHNKILAWKFIEWLSLLNLFQKNCPYLIVEHGMEMEEKIARGGPTLLAVGDFRNLIPCTRVNFVNTLNYRLRLPYQVVRTIT